MASLSFTEASAVTLASRRRSTRPGLPAAGLLAQPALQTDPLKSIRYAVWQHGACADQLQATQPNWVIEDLVRELGRAKTAKR